MSVIPRAPRREGVCPSSSEVSYDPFVISLAAKEDHAALTALLHAQLAEHEIHMSMDRLAAAIDGILTDASRGVFLVARVDGEVVGVAYLSFIWSLEHGGRSAWLEELYVRPANRSAGLGRALLLAACEHARAEACAAVDLEVETTHARAANLYIREGFHPQRRSRWVRMLAPRR